MRHVIHMEFTHVAINQDERELFVALGARVAKARKDAGITQVQLAETLGVSQQTINAYETGVRRIPVSALPTLAKVLSAGLEELLGEPKDRCQENAVQQRSCCSRLSAWRSDPRRNSAWPCR